MLEQNSQQRAMPLSSEEDEFLEVASDALPRIVELIATFPVEHRAGAFEVAERRYMQAAQDFGCTEEAARRWVAAIVRKLRTLVEQKATERGTKFDESN
jgi:DNA-directed RNA polymerase specialized sigma24 family protein